MAFQEYPVVYPNDFLCFFYLCEWFWDKFLLFLESYVPKYFVNISSLYCFRYRGAQKYGEEIIKLKLLKYRFKKRFQKRA
ncbi:MAG: hypothetical protein ACJA1B_002381 [Polaribacter sp.]|jgi:hypothetical protein